MKTLNTFVRRIVPSTAKLSYNRVFVIAGYIVDAFVNILFWQEFRALPPNHLRVRVGVKNRIFFNQVHHLTQGVPFVMELFANGTINNLSDIVEIGCGCGRKTMHIYRCEGYSGNYNGVDIDEELISYCRSAFTKKNFSFHVSEHDSTTYRKGRGHGRIERLYRLPLPDDSQDFVFSTSVFTHLLEFEIENYLSETYRVLKKDSPALMRVFIIESVRKGDRWHFEHRLGRAYIESEKVPEAAVAYEAEFLRELSDKIGFASVEFRRSEGQSDAIFTK